MVVCDCWSVGDGEVGGGGAIDVITELLNSTLESVDIDTVSIDDEEGGI